MEHDFQQEHSPLLYQERSALPNATISLVLGILSIAICGAGLVLGIIGLVLSNKDRKTYLSNPSQFSVSSYKNVNAGRICSIIGICVSAFAILAYIAWILVFISVMKSNGVQWNS